MPNTSVRIEILAALGPALEAEQIEITFQTDAGRLIQQTLGLSQKQREGSVILTLPKPGAYICILTGFGDVKVPGPGGKITTKRYSLKAHGPLMITKDATLMYERHFNPQLAMYTAYLVNKQPEDPDAEAARLSEELVQAPPGKQDQVLTKLRDSKGTVYTEALAKAIPGLTGDAKKKARDALADRLARMSAETLADKLKDDSLEIRRAASLACAMRDEKVHTPKLIELLKDPEPPVARAAHAALKSLTGKDFGPPADSTAADRDMAVAAWKAWWQKNKGD